MRRHSQLIALAVILSVFLGSHSICPVALTAQEKSLVPEKTPVEATSGKLGARQPLDISPAKEIDEQLYMLRKLEFIYSHWPTGFDDQEKVSRELAVIRHEFVKAKEYAQAKGMEARLIAMYGDSIEMAERYSELLIDLGAIDKDSYRRTVDQVQGSPPVAATREH